MAEVIARPNETIEQLLRRFKKVVEASGLLSDLRKNEYFEKPSTIRRREAAAARKRYLKKMKKHRPKVKQRNWEWNHNRTKKVEKTRYAGSTSGGGGYQGRNPNYKGKNPRPAGAGGNPNYKGNNPRPAGSGAGGNPNYKGNSYNPNYKGKNPRGGSSRTEGEPQFNKPKRDEGFTSRPRLTITDKKDK